MVLWTALFFLRIMFFNVPGLRCGTWALAALFRGWTPGPLPWECRVLASGPPGEVPWTTLQSSCTYRILVQLLSASYSVLWRFKK